jgi:hypothetical protein
MSHAPATPSHAKPPTRRRRRWLRVVLWLVIFGSGLLVGTGLTLIAVRRGVLQAIHHPEQMPTNVSRRLQRTLDLDNQQTTQIREILRRRQVDLEEIRVRYQPEIEAQLDLIRAEIGQVLDDQQRETWYQIFDNKRRIWIPPLPGDEYENAAD